MLLYVLCILRGEKMIDNYLLEELVTFKQYGTLIATAEHLLVTQPTITRGMQKLEDELQVQIFDRQPNRITLTKTGELAATEAQKVLDQNQRFINTVQRYDDSQRIIRVGSVAPGPMIVLNSLKLPNKIQFTNDFVQRDQVIDKLRNQDFSVIISDQEIQTDALESRFIGTESLSVNLDKFTYLANKPKVSFQELKGLSFIVLTEIGIWKNIIQREIPDAKFLYQNQVDAFTEITNYSNFPYFSTNLSKIDPEHHPSTNDDRVNIPIADDSAKIDFYAVYQKKNKTNITFLLKDVSSAWI